MKVWAIAALCLVAGAAWGQNTQQQYNQKEVRQAKAGESCAVSFTDCEAWCDKNQVEIGRKASCKSSCTGYHGICVSSGVWSTPLGKVEIRGLPPK